MKSIVIFILLICSGLSVTAQKVKYKDLFVLLRAKNYDDGGKFLVKFLADNPEHPNANYQMGLMLEYKLSELDILKQSDRVVERADSAILYFDKAYSLITPKDVKKHDDDYYELFKRRNLRTGKFEVILSDVQLDIENRKIELTSKKKNVVVINKAFNNSVTFYDSARNKFGIVVENYRDVISLNLGAKDSTIARINAMIIAYDSSILYFKQYKKLKKEFNSTSEDLLINVKKINAFDEIGARPIDFYSRKVDFMDFSTWGNDQLLQIEKQHQFIENLISFDESLAIMAEKITTDSVSLRSEIFSKFTDPTLKALKTLDKESVVNKLINYKLAQLNLNSGFITWYTFYADTLDVGVQLNYLGDLKAEFEGVKKLESMIVTSFSDQFWIRYSSFVTKRYQSKEQFVDFVESQKDILKTQEHKLIFLDSLVQEKDTEGYLNGESIPLVFDSDSLAKYHTFYLDSLGDRVFDIIGLIKSDTSYNLYFATVPSSRQIDSLFTLETSLTLQDVSKESFIMLKEKALESSALYLIGDSIINNYTLIYFSISSGVLWERKLEETFSGEPSLSYSEGKISLSEGEIILKVSLEDGSILE